MRNWLYEEGRIIGWQENPTPGMTQALPDDHPDVLAYLNREPVPASVSRQQLLTALAKVGWITEDEALAALETGARPSAVNALIDQMSEEERFDARMKWAGFRDAYRADEMVSALAAAEGKSDGEVDDFFRLAAGL